MVALGVFGALSALFAFLCNIHALADFLSIGTLIAFVVVCANLCILRFCHQDGQDIEEQETSSKPFPSQLEDGKLVRFPLLQVILGCPL